MIFISALKKVSVLKGVRGSFLFYKGREAVLEGGLRMGKFSKNFIL